MFNFFPFKNKEIKKEKKINSLILDKLDRITELLEQQKDAKGQNIHFETVQIDYLENIVFRLDNIEIDELSGKLIIGNNISTTEDLAKPLVLKLAKENVKQEAKSENTSAHQQKIIRTPKGFHFRNDFQ